MRTASACNIGACRMVNQDRIFASAEPVGALPNLFIVADGMGGHAAGETAAQEAVDFCVRYASESSMEETDAFFYQMAAQTNAHVYALSQSHAEYAGMGTTLVAASILPDGVYCVNVGDSRMYMVDHKDRFVRVTRDHSLVELMVSKGELTEEEARVHPKRNYITRAVGTAPEVEADLYKLPAGYARMLLLCSDGLSSQIADERISEIVKTRSLSLTERVDMLVNEANRNGGTDNISIILVEMEGVEA